MSGIRIENGRLHFTNDGHLEKNLREMHEFLIDGKNKDMPFIICGSPGAGKSAVTFLCQAHLMHTGLETPDDLPRTGYFKNWAFTHDGFIHEMQIGEKNKFIGYDEGYNSFYRREGMTKKNKEALSTMWQYRFKNHTVFINFQNISDIEPDLLKRVVGILRIVKQGWGHFYNQKQIQEIEIDTRTKKVTWPRRPAFRFSFPDPANTYPHLWEEYENMNEEELQEQAEEREEGEAEPTNWISTGTAAERMDVSPATIRNWCDEDRIKHSTLPNGDRRIPEDEIDRLLEN